MKTKLLRCYSELAQFTSLEERYQYLRLGGIVGSSSWGFDRYLNQALYTCNEWRSLRDKIIVRDQANDLGVDGYPIGGKVIVHHMNALVLEDVEDRDPNIFNPEYLICVSLRTHNAIHFGDDTQLPRLPIERRPGDTCPWR